MGENKTILGIAICVSCCCSGPYHSEKETFPEILYQSLFGDNLSG